MPATGSRVARTAFARLMVRCAVGLRIGSAVAGGIAAFAGLAPPASVAAVATAVTITTAWSAAYAVLLLRGRGGPWPVVVDAAVAAALGLAVGTLIPAMVLADTTGWVFLYASTTVIISPLVSRTLLGVAVGVAVPAAYAAGLQLAPGAGPPGGAVLLLVQGMLVTVLMIVLRRAPEAADAAVLQREAAERQAAVLAARRAQEREHYRLLHDSVSATLTVVAAGGIDAGSASLPAQARRDLAVVERLNGPDAAAGPDLPGWLRPVVAGRAVTVEAPIPAVPVPAAVGAALAGATTEALTNAARHAAPARVQLRAAVEPDGAVTVLVADDGPGFDPAAVPASRRGVRESLVGRMRAVHGDATVSSRPGGGTQVLLRWPSQPDGADDPTAGPVLGELIATRYQRGFDLVVILLVAFWHVGNDLLELLAGWSDYRRPVAELLAWLALAAVGAAAGFRLWYRRTGRGGTWLLAGTALGAGAVGIAAVPAGLLFSGTNWAWGATGWFGVLVLLRRPPRELAAFLAINAAVALAVLADAGALDRIGVARAATMIYGTAALQVTLLLAARALAATARRAATVAEAEGAVRRRRQVAERLHAARRHRYRTVRDAVAPLLAGLADGTLDPADRAVRHRCAVEASRLRRLFAETDDVADPLLHELRACSYIADQRGVLVDLQLTGRLPALDRDVRRALTEAPLLALAGAERRARVTVLGRTDEVAVSVLVDGRGPAVSAPAAGASSGVTVSVLDEEDRRWVEARWRR
jgi:signal transduction histidine kinase